MEAGDLRKLAQDKILAESGKALDATGEAAAALLADLYAVGLAWRHAAGLGLGDRTAGFLLGRQPRTRRAASDSDRPEPTTGSVGHVAQSGTVARPGEARGTSPIAPTPRTEPMTARSAADVPAEASGTGAIA